MVECALMSPVMMLFVSVSRYWNVFVMSVSSVAWSGSVVCLGGMKMLVMCRCLCCERWILMLCNSIFLVLSVFGGSRGVKVILLWIYVSRPPPCL